MKPISIFLLSALCCVTSCLETPKTKSFDSARKMKFKAPIIPFAMGIESDIPFLRTTRETKTISLDDFYRDQSEITSNEVRTHRKHVNIHAFYLDSTESTGNE